MPIKDSLVLVILIAAFLLFAVLNSIWVGSLVNRIDSIEKLSTSIDNTILSRVNMIEQRSSTCACS